jgi:flagellar hook-basal body complex protein FliE
MKKLNFVCVFCLISLLSFNAAAFNLNEIIKKDKDGRVTISGDDLSKGLDSKFTKELQDQLKKTTKDVNTKIEELKTRADQEINKIASIIDEAKEQLNILKQIRSKIRGYIIMAYIIVGFLGFLLIVLILLVIKMWLKISQLGKISYVFKTVKEFDDRIKRLEEKIKK